MTEQSGEMPEEVSFGFEEIVHQRTRLAILAILSEAGEADFAFLRKTLGLTDGNLGRHLEILVEAGYVSARKGYDGRRSRTWARLTPKGQSALQVEVATLKMLIDRVERSPEKD